MQEGLSITTFTQSNQVSLHESKPSSYYYLWRVSAPDEPQSNVWPKFEPLIRSRLLKHRKQLSDTMPWTWTQRSSSQRQEALHIVFLLPVSSSLFSKSTLSSFEV